MDETKTSKAQMESPCISGQAKRQATVRVRNRVDMRGGSEAELSRRPVDAGEQSTSTTAPSTAKHESTEEKTNERRGGEEREKEKKRRRRREGARRVKEERVGCAGRCGRPPRCSVGESKPSKGSWRHAPLADSLAGDGGWSRLPHCGLLAVPRPRNFA